MVKPKGKTYYKMLLTTTNTIEGHVITDYHGVITGEAIIGANLFKDIFASITDLVGGRSGSYERVLREAKQQAMEELEHYAQSLGATAVIGIDLDYETIGQSSSMLMVTASGTAVTYQK